MGPSKSRADADAVRQRIRAVVDSIPPGRVATYGQVAREAGLPRRARLVGRVLSELPEGSPLPWHRVVNAQGRISLRGDSSVRNQRKRLRTEGIACEIDRVDLGCYQWNGDS